MSIEDADVGIVTDVSLAAITSKTFDMTIATTIAGIPLILDICALPERWDDPETCFCSLLLADRMVFVGGEALSESIFLNRCCMQSEEKNGFLYGMGTTTGSDSYFVE